MWYYFYNQQSFGPVSLEEIIRLIQMGVLTNTTLVWQPQHARRQAGQVPELAQYFQQSSRARPQPVSQGAAMSSHPVQEQSYASGAQQAPTGNNSATSSTKRKKGSLFLKICFIAIIVCSLISAFGTFIYWGCYENMIIAFSQYGVLAIDDVTRSNLSSASSVSIAFYLFAFLFCVPIVIMGIIRKNYSKAIICVVMACTALGYYIYTEISEENKMEEIRQQLSTIPYYDEVAILRKDIISAQDFVGHIAEDQPYDLYPEEVERCAQWVVAEFRELDKYNTQTLEMLLHGENTQEIERRYVYAARNYSQIYHQFHRVYKSYRNRE